MQSIHKYPRTHHVVGSKFQACDEELSAVPFKRLAGRHLVVEEKLDGANCGISFGTDGELQLQSRGHLLTGGPRERHFTLFKQWANVHQAALRDRLGAQYVLYGEWLYAKHTVFYDALPHYLLEFDVLDTSTGLFLSTARRAELLQRLPIASVPVLFEGQLTRQKQLLQLLGPSRFVRPNHLDRLRAQAEQLRIDVARVLRETDPSTQMEGLYIKIEEGGHVVERYKYVRGDFLASVFTAEGHWLNRPIVPNLLEPGVDLFAGE